MTITKAALTASVYEQIMAFFEVCDSEAIEANHIKLHGALYNYAAKDAPTADAVVDAIVATKRRPKLYVPPNSILGEKAKNLLPITFEAFIDRRYNTDLSLVSRTGENALISDSDEAWKQLKSMVLDREVETLGGRMTPIEATTFCMHGDNPNAVAMLQFVHKQLAQFNIRVA